MQGDLDIVTRSEHVLTDETGRARLLERLRKNAISFLELTANIDECMVRADAVGAEQHPFEHQMRTFSRSMRSLNVPGSASSELQTR